MTEVEVVTLEDGKSYTVVKEKQLDGITYLYLVSDVKKLPFGRSKLLMESI